MSRKKRKKRIRITRLINSLLILAIVTISVAAGGSRLAQVLKRQGDLHAAGPLEVQKIVVSTGDTLWGLALKHGPQGVDPRQVVTQIRDLNHLTDVNIVPGMVLYIPHKITGSDAQACL
ncbi:MAG TPA: LysM peptidoglycan-binding domain-containing protein [Firmicutes bacterium]|nr:LysM peptidoglycan-binding domain-containing protein [Bacillota bacterium]